MSGITPMVTELQPGTHWICSCGQTKNAPFCDGTHKGSGKSPVQKTVEGAPQRFAWCRCRHSGNLPQCDGSHKK
ncbi:MAG: CDGSH iron-sulfur domain-containing protein [Planctomycetes bacterium]|nr:CDGSH iron-sulfur domain-containing protein [Planctomycetota bacterium]NUQ34553.1 CDGSH iron-sulfur domain-containing protein [Planctomycetaceae bacterium]